MPVRKQTKLQSSMQQYIGLLYQQPALKFLKHDEPWEDLADLIFGPSDLCTDKFFNEDVRQKGFKRLEELRKLWVEFRGDIVSAHKHYQPKKKPWGCRFDAGKIRVG